MKSIFMQMTTVFQNQSNLDKPQKLQFILRFNINSTIQRSSIVSKPTNKQKTNKNNPQANPAIVCHDPLYTTQRTLPECL